MNEEIEDYVRYLLSFSVIEKPIMPKFDVLAYTDNEYLSVVFGILKEFDFLDSEPLTINHLKGE